MKNLLSIIISLVFSAPVFSQQTQTSLCLPNLTTNSPILIGLDSVVIGGDIINDGGSNIVLRGICYSTIINPNMGNPRTEDGSGIGSFATILRNLSPGTTYYARSYAKNSGGLVAYGNEVSFTTAVPAFSCGTSSITDVDGNSYNTVQIGTQCWTQSNLKVSKYRDGSSITNITDATQWSQTNTSSTGAWCHYNNDAANEAIYGKLYNGYAVNDSRGLCPTGWHVPTDGEWTTLENHLGGAQVAGGAMKSMTGWTSNTGATNSSGFTALPGGTRTGGGGGFGTLGDNGFWWSSSDAGSGSAWFRGLTYYYAGVNRGNLGLRFGFSVRCARD